MLGFVNERSFEGHSDWAAALQTFVLLAQELRPAGMQLFRDSQFFKTDRFKVGFNKLSLAKDLKALARDMAYGDRVYRCWRPERISDAGCAYTCASPTLELQDESLAEAAERSIEVKVIVAAVSASDSVFGKANALEIVRVPDGREARLPSFSSPIMARNWLAQQPDYYGPASQEPPRDGQTILEKDSVTYVPTKYRERKGGRRVFERQDNGWLLYVDNFHVGAAAHLEVFTRQREHLGIADIGTGELQAGTKVKGRVVRY